MNQNPTILITGGAGFIGVSTARRFLKNKWNVIIFDSLSRKGSDINLAHLELEDYPNLSIMKNDIRTDKTELENAVGKADVALHLAAQVAVTTSISDPQTDFEINAIGTFNLLEAVRKSNSKPLVIYSSTNKVFGALEDYPVKSTEFRYEFEDEAFRQYGVPGDQPLDFHSPYGCSKGAADQYVVDYARIYDLNTVSFRQSCIYGTNQFGIEDQGWVAWFSIATLLDKPLTLYGNGRQVRDILYIDDLVDLYAKAIEKRDILKGNAYVVGGGTENTISLLELLDLLEQKLNKRTNISLAEIRAGDQPIFYADIRALEKDLDWRPKTNINDGIDKMLNWIKEHQTEIIEVTTKK